MKLSVAKKWVNTRLADTPQAVGRSRVCKLPLGTATVCLIHRIEVLQLPTGPVGMIPVATGISGPSCTMEEGATFQILKAASQKVLLPLGNGSNHTTRAFCNHPLHRAVARVVRQTSLKEYHQCSVMRGRKPTSSY